MLRVMLLLLAIVNATDALAVNWVSFGDFRGIFEPCGCDPSSDLGGIYRAGALVQQIKQLDNESLVFINGKNFSSDKKREKENNLIAESIAELQVTAALPTSLVDLKLYGNLKIPMVLTNNLDLSIPKSKIVSGICVLGFSKFGSKLSDDILTRKSKVSQICGGLKSVFILTDFDETSVSKLADFYKPTVILRASSREMNAKPDGMEKKNPSNLMSPDIGFSNYQMPLGAAGAFVSEGIFRSISELDYLFGKKQICPDTRKEKSTENPREILFSECKLRELPIVWLEKKYDEKLSLTKKVLEKNRVLQLQKFQKNLIDGLPYHVSSKFIGSNQCQKCHLEPYKVWEKSKHSGAIQVLLAAKRQEDYDCIGCHVVGFEKKGGYLDQANTPHLASVGCENCHGPGKDHAQNPTLHKTSGDKFICTECHVNGHSPNFDLAKYWREIQHGKVLSPMNNAP